MIVPLASSKIMKVFGASGFSLFDDRNILEIKPLDSSVVMMDKLVLSSLAGMGSPFDSSSASIQLFSRLLQGHSQAPSGEEPSRTFLN